MLKNEANSELNLAKKDDEIASLRRQLNMLHESVENAKNEAAVFRDEVRYHVS